MGGAPMRWLILGVLGLVGCSSGGPFEYVPVSGQITYDDGSVIKASTLRVVFIALDQKNEDPNVKPRPATANIDPATGKFDSVTSYKYGDGLVPGRHRVAVAALGPTGQGLNVIPAKYSDVASSPLIVDTKDAPLMIKIPKK